MIRNSIQENVCFVIKDMFIMVDTAMAVSGVFTKTNIGDHHHIWASGFDGFNHTGQ